MGDISRSITARLCAYSILLSSISFHMDLSDSCGWIERRGRGTCYELWETCLFAQQRLTERERVERVVLLQRQENATELLCFPAYKYSQGLQLYNKSIASVSNTLKHTHRQKNAHTHNRQRARTHK